MFTTLGSGVIETISGTVMNVTGPIYGVRVLPDVVEIDFFSTWINKRRIFH